MSPEAYVHSLLDYAKAVLVYGLSAGFIKDHALSQAIADVEGLEPKTAASEKVVELKRQLAAALSGLPADTRAALRTPSFHFGSAWQSSVWAKLALIVFSIVLMFATGRMTYVHNKRVSIAQELDNLTLVDPERTLSQMVWTLAQAGEQMQGVDNSNDPELELAFMLINLLCSISKP